MTAKASGALKSALLCFLGGFVCCAGIVAAIRISQGGSSTTEPAGQTPGTDNDAGAEVRVFDYTVENPHQGLSRSGMLPIASMEASVRRMVSEIRRFAATPATGPARDPYRIVHVKMGVGAIKIRGGLMDTNTDRILALARSLRGPLGETCEYYLLRWNDGKIAWTAVPFAGDRFSRESCWGEYQTVADAIIGLARDLGELEELGYPEQDHPDSTAKGQTSTIQQRKAKREALTAKYTKLLRECCAEPLCSSSPATRPANP